VASIHKHQVLLHRLIACMLSLPEHDRDAVRYAAFKARYEDNDVHVDHGGGKWYELKRAELAELDGITNRQLGGCKRPTPKHRCFFCSRCDRQATRGVPSS
jgi:hypothetical protein